MGMSEIPWELCRGNVVRTATLIKDGWSRAQLRRAVRSGRLERLRHGWYAFPGADADVVRAVRSGGVLGCVSALKFHGAWDLGQTRLHVHRSEFGRGKGGKLPWCRPVGDRPSPRGGVDDVADALRSASCCVSDDDFVVLLDSVIDRGLLTRAQAECCLSGISDRVDRLVEMSDRAESGSETMVRLRLRSRNVSIRPQVTIPGIGRVDFLVGKRLVIEVDSVEHHTSATNYHRDRLRDQRLVARGYLVIRVTWEQVMFGWDELEERIMSIIRNRLHLRDLVGPPRAQTAACTRGQRHSCVVAAYGPRFGIGDELDGDELDCDELGGSPSRTPTGRSSRAQSSSSASRMGTSLATDSANSACGSESATMPHPANRCARFPVTRPQRSAMAHSPSPRRSIQPTGPL